MSPGNDEATVREPMIKKHVEESGPDLETTLREFREELSRVEEPSGRSRELIAQVRADLDRLDSYGSPSALVGDTETLGDSPSLDDPGGPVKPEESESILERIEDAAGEFQAEHPVLASSLRRIAHFLSGAGV